MTKPAIHLVLTGEEFEAVRSAAAADRRTPTAWVRLVVQSKLAELTSVTARPLDPEPSRPAAPITLDTIATASGFLPGDVGAP